MSGKKFEYVPCPCCGGDAFAQFEASQNAFTQSCDIRSLEPVDIAEDDERRAVVAGDVTGVSGPGWLLLSAGERNRRQKSDGERQDLGQVSKSHRSEGRSES